MAGLQKQFEACQRTRNHMLILETPVARDFVQSLDPEQRARCELITESDLMNPDKGLTYDAALFEGDGDALIAFNQALTQREGPLVLAQGLSPDEIESGATYRLEPLLREVSISVNTAAAGGNASLMMIG